MLGIEHFTAFSSAGPCRTLHHTAPNLIPNHTHQPIHTHQSGHTFNFHRDGSERLKKASKDENNCVKI